MSNPIISTKQGKIKGELTKNDNDVPFYVFKGIPYAKAPVGKLRFLVPQPPEPWEDVRDGTKNCNICAQLDQVTREVVGDEDCLFLNVYTPTLPEPNIPLLPVMVLVHAGGFLNGDGTDSAIHGPEFLIEKDVVLVSFNYRVGILGFLSLDLKEAPGNMGMRDQVEALKWVQKNIVNFGGDPNNVTIFGVSAGGASVEYLLISPAAKGLFHKAISQSGSSLMHWAQNRNIKDLAHQIPALKGETVTDDKELLNFLKEMPIEELITLSKAAIRASKVRGRLHFGFVPTIENPSDWEPFISESTYQLLAKGEFTKVPYMTGICAREGLLMVIYGRAILDQMLNDYNFLDHFPFKLDDTEKAELPDKLKDIYLNGEKTFTEADAFTIDFFSDADFVGAVYTAAMLISKHSSPVYFYEFAYDGALNFVKKCFDIDRKGVCHADDLGYLLKTDKLPYKLSETDKYVKNVIVELWTNFAKSGDPNPKTDELISTRWEPIISGTGPACFVINEGPYMKYEVYPKRAKFYQELYEKKRGKTVNSTVERVPSYRKDSFVVTELNNI